MVYGRRYGERELRFEASGGLMHGSLVMRDKETDSYWSIMTGDALAGELRGTRLLELPVGVKVRWRDWLAEHPETLVLSVDGVEHEPDNPYLRYFESDAAYRGRHAKDDRLPTKTPVYAFHLDGRSYAAPHGTFEGGAAFRVRGGRSVLLYRPVGAEIFRSSVAYVARGSFERRDGAWTAPGGAILDPAAGVFVGGDARGVRRLDGFDTFWFNWSMSNPRTRLLR